MHDGSDDDTLAPGQWPLLKPSCSMNTLDESNVSIGVLYPLEFSIFDMYIRDVIASEHLVTG